MLESMPRRNAPKPTIVFGKSSGLHRAHECSFRNLSGFGHFHQRFEVANDDGFAARADNSLAFPLAEQAAHGEEGGAGQLSQFLAGETDLEHTLRMLAQLVRKADEL